MVNPFASELRFPDHQTRMRRDHKKYLALIDAVALLHQYQRPVKEVERGGTVIRYIEVTRGDIAVANRLAHEVLGRSLDELPPQTRRLLGLLDAMVAEGSEKLGVERRDFRFSRREVRERIGWGNTQLKVHLGRLVELEYVVVHSGSGHRQRFDYELMYEPSRDDGPYLPGLIEGEQLGGHGYDANRSGKTSDRSGQNSNRSGSGRPLVGVRSGGGRSTVTELTQQQNSGNGDSEQRKGPGALQRATKSRAPHRSHSSNNGAAAEPSVALAAVQ